MKYVIEYTHKAWNDLRSLKLSESQRIAKKMRFFMDHAQPMQFAKSLKGEYKGLYRFRIGDYRAIFKKDANGKLVVLTIIRIKHRKAVYE